MPLYSTVHYGQGYDNAFWNGQQMVYGDGDEDMPNWYDTGGVHINSGIPNHAFYFVATEIGGYAWEKAGEIWYITLRDRLRRNSDFQDAADLTFQVAGQLFGNGSAEQQAVSNGWSQVGITVAAGGGSPRRGRKR